MAVSYLGGLVRSRSVGANSTALRAYPIKNGAHAAMYTGTPVKLSAGTLDVATNNATVVGVAQSFQWIDKTTAQPQFSKFIPANTSQKNSGYFEGFTQPFALVDDNPAGTWICKTDVSIAATFIGELARVTNAGAGSTVTGRGAAEVDSTGTAVSAGNAMVRVIAAYKIGEITSAGAEDNGFSGTLGDASTLLEVRFSNHLYS